MNSELPLNSAATFVGILIGIPAIVCGEKRAVLVCCFVPQVALTISHRDTQKTRGIGFSEMP